MCFCRDVFEVPVFLCIWHVLRAMQKKLWQTLSSRSKTDFKDIMKHLHEIMYMEPKGTASEKQLAVEARMEQLLASWEASSNDNYKQGAKYARYWAGKLSEFPHSLGVNCCSTHLYQCAM